MSIKKSFIFSLLILASHVMNAMEEKVSGVKRVRAEGAPGLKEAVPVTDSHAKTKRVRNLYDPASEKFFKISRNKLELFMRCRRCFYLDRRLGISQPAGYPFNLNNAVDALLKKEFDIYRAEQKVHPICLENGLNAIPLKHVDIEKWRDALRRGVQCMVPNTNIMLQGGLDDVWINCNTQELIVVDYKATSKQGIVSLDAEWQKSYKRQVEVYQWLLRNNGFSVSKIAYFVYCNAKADGERFDKKLVFDMSLLPYEGNDSWVEPAVIEAQQCLQSDDTPSPADDCEYCRYWQNIKKHMDGVERK